ncbi:MAG: protein phosphatase 2C domain-containing protein [Pseudomonadota bacterium]
MPRIRRHIQRQNPFAASREADRRGRAEKQRDPARTRFFAEREVLERDGSFPFGEGYLYGDAGPSVRDPSWQPGIGTPGTISAAGHRGTKPQQQDAWGSLRLRVGKDDAAVLVVADGVSASGPRAARAAKTAVRVFLRELEQALARVPTNEARRHATVEKAMSHAAFFANFEVVRQVLLDRDGSGRFDSGDRRALRRDTGVDLKAGTLTVAEMRRIAPQLDKVIADEDEAGRSALATFAVAVAVDNDLYTFATGDAVVSLYRPGEIEQQRVIQLTHRDQAVVELYTSGEETRGQADLYENVITDSLGDSAQLAGTLRRYPNLLEPGDRVIAASDGLGPRGPHQGLDRHEIEAALEAAEPEHAARNLVRGQIEDVDADTYQDNIGVVVLTIDPR